MKITQLEPTGNSTKFTVELGKGRGEFMLSFSFTLVNKIWKLNTDEEKLAVAERVAQALVGRHDPSQPFKDKYIFSDHNAKETVDEMVTYLNKTAL